ncbi:MAG: carbon-nitrogen hydrolase family protein [Alphaproteobacteria bacterium]
MRAACIQLRSGTDIDDNLERVETLIRQAAKQGAKLIATPEMTHILQRKSAALFAAIKPEDEDIGVALFSKLAKELNVHLLIGSLAVLTGERRASNRSLLFGPDGQVVGRYDKIHLFDVTVSETETWKESRVYDAGKTGVVAPVGDFKLGMTVCYDLRFPHLYRGYAQAGAHIMSVPAAFTKPTGKAHWEVLLRARAIETGSYVIAPAQGGVHEDGRETWGHSMVVDPWGEIIAELAHNEPGVLIADFDLEDVLSARQRVPAWHHNPEFSL